MLKQATVSPKQSAQLLAVLDVHVVRVIFKKETKHKTVESVYSEFVDGLNKASNSQTPNPWATSVAAAAAAVLATASASNWLQFDAKQLPLKVGAAVIMQNGFAAGSRVQHADGKIATVVSISDDGVVRLRFDAGAEINQQCQQFLDAWRLSNKTAELLTGWQGFETNPEFDATCLKSEVMLALQALMRQHPTPNNVHMRAKPTKGLIANRVIKKHKLVLVPVTTKVVSSIAPPAYGVAIPGTNCYLMPERLSKDEKYAVPAWFVQTTANAEQANVSWNNERVSLTATAGKKAQDARSVSVPVLTNHVDVAEGDELFVFLQYVEPKQTAHKRDISLAAVSSPKRGKPKV